MLLSNKKTIIAFVLGLVVMWIVWLISVSISPKAPLFPWAENLPADVQQRMNAARQAALSHSGINAASPITWTVRIMPWQTAATLLKSAPVEKIQVDGLDLKITIGGGLVFTTTQPRKDAYLPLIKGSKSKIQIIK